jgi:alpha-D-ribose 1-methylphosphonate 5-triphosphate diphosphatase PhnM
MRTILTNARVVLPESDIQGSVVIDDGCIEEVTARNYSDGINLHGAILSPRAFLSILRCTWLICVRCTVG